MYSEYFVAGYIGAYMPLTEMCLTQKDLNDYGKGKTIYGWYISDLKIYDKPKELSEFKTCYNGCKERDTCHCKFYCYGERSLTHQPQSWQYVKELDNGNTLFQKDNR